jgi:hypothetical protein
MPDCVCGKKFKTIKPFQKHRVLCEAKIYYYKNDIVDSDDVPDNIELWKIVRSLMDKVDNHEKTIKQLRQICYKQNKTIDVISILNDKYAPRQDYNRFLENIMLSDDDLKNIFKIKLIQGMTNLIVSILSRQNIKTRPIQYFKEKKEYIYIYSLGKWRQKKIDTGVKIIKKIYNNLFNYYKLYNDRREDDNDDKFGELNTLIIDDCDKIKTYKKIHFNVRKELNISVKNTEDL